MELPESLKTIYYCYPEGKKKALTMSYDDGYEADRTLVAIFNRFGVRGTFNINAGNRHQEQRQKRIQLDELSTLYAGHEIAAHSYTHPTIARIPRTERVRQVLLDRIALEKAVGSPVRGFAYPNGSYNRQIQELLPALGISYARIATRGHHDFFLPENPFAWEATCHHNHNLLEDAERFLSQKRADALMYVWGHSFEFTDAGNWSLMEDFCKMVGKRDDIWYATNGEIIDWMAVNEALVFAADGSFVYNPSSCDAWLTVDGNTVRVPGGKQTAL